jgi:hypothetical protein
VFDGWLLGKSEWALWDFVGRVTCQMVDVKTLEAWRKELVLRYTRVAAFHRAVNEVFQREVGIPPYSQRRFDATTRDAYFEREIGKLLSAVSFVAALALDEAQPGALVARFSESLLCEGRPKINTAEKVKAKLETAFAGSNFDVVIQEAL